MADYWKSQPRKFCDFCKCWIADNKPSRDFHERGKRHQENVAKRISELRKKGFEHARNEKDAAKWMIEMEKEALKKLREDLSTDPSLAAQYGVKIKSRNEKEEERSQQQPPSAAAGSHETDVAAGEWQEALSEEGYVYYWNSETGESRWELPVSDDSPVDKSRESNEEAQSVPSAENTPALEKPEKSEDLQALQSTDGGGGASLWQRLSSPEGYPYYWNTKTGKVSWKMPSEFVGLKKGQLPKENKDLTETVVKEPSDHSKENVATEATPPTAPVTENSTSEPGPVVETAEFSRKRSTHAVYGEWQELKEECEQQVDLELPTNQNKTEVDTIVLSKEPKVLFKEKTISSLGPRGTEHVAVEFKKRRINSGAAKGNIRRTNNNNDVDS